MTSSVNDTNGVLGVSRPFRRIHIINPFWNAFGGSEQRALALFELLKGHTKVYLWCGPDPDARLAERHCLNRIQIPLGRFPKRGTFVLVGIYAGIGDWIRRTNPDRLIVVINTAQKSVAEDTLARLGGMSAQPEIVYASEEVRALVGAPGRVERSPIDLSAFVPAPRGPHARFTVGRLSRDDETKHHADDPALYSRVLAEGCSVRIMGGTVLKDKFGDIEQPHLELLPAGAERATDFLQGLDCFLYRTSAGWYETYGRVVYEAMACGLPVVASRQGGYACDVVHGENGFLFGSDDEALDILLRLKNDPDLCARVGAVARRTIERLYGADAMDRVRKFYLIDAPVI
jgi:glycosyltransferase involved in cell wall biosynthesis